MLNKHDKAVEKFELTHSDTKEKASEKGVVLYMANCSHQGRDKVLGSALKRQPRSGNKSQKKTGNQYQKTGQAIQTFHLTL